MGLLETNGFAGNQSVVSTKAISLWLLCWKDCEENTGRHTLGAPSLQVSLSSSLPMLTLLVMFCAFACKVTISRARSFRRGFHMTGAECEPASASPAR